MVHPNDEAHLRHKLLLAKEDPWPPSLPELYARYRYLSDRDGSGTMPFATMTQLCIAVQDAERAAGRPVPALPPHKTRPIPQHQITPKSAAEKTADKAVKSASKTTVPA